MYRHKSDNCCTTTTQKLLRDRFELCRLTQWQRSVGNFWVHTLRQIWTSSSVLKPLLRQRLWARLHFTHKKRARNTLTNQHYFLLQATTRNGKLNQKVKSNFKVKYFFQPLEVSFFLMLSEKVVRTPRLTCSALLPTHPTQNHCPV